MKKFLISCVSIAAMVLLAGCAGSGGLANGSATASANPNTAPAGTGVWFMEPQNGATIGQTFKVKFGVKDMDVEPAGEQKKDKGHHHFLVNLASKPAGEVNPFDDQHMHFGKGQLPPGNYKLTMQFADGFHLSYGQLLSTSINVTVK